MDKNFDISTNVVKQHTVPRFLLDNFGFFGNGKRKKLFTFDKHNEKIYQTSVFDATTRNTFYDIDNHPDRASLEPLLGVYESQAAPLIAEIIRRKDLSFLNADQKYIVAYFIAVQRARSFGELQRVNSLIKCVSDKLFSLGAQTDEIEKVFGSDPESEQKNTFLRMIIDQRDIAPILLNKGWVLFETELSDPFYISDNPLTLFNSRDLGFYGNLGLSSPGIQIFLPISSTLTLGLLCSSIIEEWREKKKKAQQYIASAKYRTLGVNPFEMIRKANQFIDGGPIMLKPHNVEFYNSLQVEFSEQYVFCQINDFSLVERMIKNNARHKGGPRMTT
jgi:hypothetical protein